MPYTLTWEPHGVYKRFTGQISGTELVRSVNEVANDARFAHARYEISDYLGASATEFSQDALNEVRALRMGSFSRNPKLRLAIVSLDTQTQQRIYSTLAAQLTQHQTRLFSDLEQANAWLGRTEGVPA